MYYGGFSWKETLHMPVPFKRWYIERIVKELNKGTEQGQSTQSRALQHNSPDVRALQGRSRSQVPSRLRRFT